MKRSNRTRAQVFLWLIALIACQLSSVARGSTTDNTVRYEINPIFNADERYAVDVIMTLFGDSTGNTVISLPWVSPRFGGGGLTDIVEVYAEGAAMTRDEHKLMLTHDKNQLLKIRYTVKSNGAPVSTNGVMSFALDSTWFAGYAWGLLATVEPDTRPASLTWSADASKFRHIDTFSKKAATVAKIGHVLIAGGPGLDVEEKTIAGHIVTFVSAGSAPQRKGEILGLMDEVLADANAVFPDKSSEPYTIGFFWIKGGERNNFSASASERALLAFGNEAKPLEYFRDHLQHEAFHYWIPGLLGRDDGEYRASENWLSEGFADALSWRTMLRFKRITVQQYVDHLNVVLRDYATNKSRTLTKAQLDSSQDVSAFKLPYAQGELIALLMDKAVQKANGKSIETVLRAAVKHAQSNSATGRGDLIWALNRNGVNGKALMEELTRPGFHLTVPIDFYGSCATVTPPASVDEVQTVRWTSGLTGYRSEACTVQLLGSK